MNGKQGHRCSIANSLDRQEVHVEDTYKAVEEGRSGKGMAQPLTEDTRSSSRSTGKIMNILLWVLQIGAAGMFLTVGFLKLSGNVQLVGLFEAIGLGQW